MLILLRVLGLSVAHFVVAAIASFLTYGADLDQLRSRSALSRWAGVLHDVLWYPHDAFLRALPAASFTRPMVVPAALIGNSLVWGAGLYLLWRVARRLRESRRAPGGSRPA